jgi:hypothetical protein
MNMHNQLYSNHNMGLGQVQIRQVVTDHQINLSRLQNGVYQVRLIREGSEPVVKSIILAKQ